MCRCFHKQSLHKTFAFVLAMLLFVQTALPAAAQSANPPTGDTPVVAESVAASGLLYRTQISVTNSARWQRLESLGITILERTDDTAVVLVDDGQLERLAALGFRPQQTDAVESMVVAQSQPWLARSLQPLFREASSTRSRMATDDSQQRAASVVQLQAAMTALTAEQRLAVADLTSLDDDGDGLSNTQEGWWCTNPLDADSDDDGKNDGVEIAALKAWMNNERDRAPGETPWVGWPFVPANEACPDKDLDSIPNNAERWELGLNQDRESTDRDRYDDGQELFGTTYCPATGGYCGYGLLPRTVDSGTVFAEMPTWVKAPANHPLVAAFPVVEIDLVADEAGNTFRVETVTTITSDQTVTTGTTRSYSTESSQSVSTGVEDTITFNDYVEASKSYEVPVPSTLQRDSPPIGICNYGDDNKQGCESQQMVQGTSTSSDQALQAKEFNLAPGEELCTRPYSYFSGVDPLSFVQLTSIADAQFTGGSTAGVAAGILELGKNLLFSEGKTGNLDCSFSFPSWSIPDVDQPSDSDVIPAIDEELNRTHAFLPEDQRGNFTGNSDRQVIVNHNFDTSNIVRGLDGMALAYRETGELIGSELHGVSMSIDDLTNATSDGFNKVASGLNTIAGVLAAPRETTTTLKGSSRGGAQTTSHTQIQSNSVITGEAFLTQESWSQATAVDAAHAADLWFTYDISNQGTEYALDICDVAFNIYINNLSLPAYTHYVGADRGGDTCFSNFMAGESHRYTTKIPLSLEQLKAIDLNPACSKETGGSGSPAVCAGGKVVISLEDYTYGVDSELLYQDAANSGVLIAVEDGTDDGQEEINKFLMPIWGDDTILDVITRYFPTLTDDDGDIVAIWTPEGGPTPADWCQAPRVVGSTVWCRHALSTAEWWNVYTANLAVGSDGYENSAAVPGSVVFFRFNQDSDWDGYNDRIEVSLGTDPNDSTSFPWPELIAGLLRTRVGNQVTASLSMLNLGLSDAFAISAVMVAPDDSITVVDNAVGGAGRVRAQTQVNVGAVIKLQEPIPAAWYQAGHARLSAGGFYVGSAERTYSFAVSCVESATCVVGSGSWTLAWTDGTGNSGTLDFDAGYTSPQFVEVGDFGVRIALAEGSVSNGEIFAVVARPSLDTFQYTVNREPHTPPMVIVSYNDPKGNRRFVIPPAATDLDDPVTQLRGYRGQMLHNVGVDIFTVGAVEAGSNTTNLIVSNPTDATLANAHLILEFIDADGRVVYRINQQTNLPPGPQVRAVIWDTSQFSTPYDADQGYLLMAYLTDYQNIILDSAAKPMEVYSTPEQLRKVFVAHSQQDVGTVPWPETFTVLNSLLGGSLTSTPLKQSLSYRLQGSTGEPVVNHQSVSSFYTLRSGYWSAILARLEQLRTRLASRTTAEASDATDAVARFPTQRFTLVNEGNSLLQLRVANLDSDITLIQAPAAVLAGGQHTELEVRLNTNNLGVGPFSKTFSVFTNDPTQPEIPLTISGNVQRQGDLVFVRDSQTVVQPLTKIVRVNSARDTGAKVSFKHEISSDIQNLYPLFLFAGNETTELGQGDVLTPTAPTLHRFNGDAAATELTLPQATSTRRDYVIRYGYQTVLNAAGFCVYQMPVPFRYYDTFTIDVVARNMAAGPVQLTLDIGNNVSVDWQSTSLSNTNQTTTTVNLAQAINNYLAGLTWSVGGYATVPIKFSSSTAGTYFLTNARGTVGLNTDLNLPPVLQASNSTPIETDTIQLCTTVRNNGKSSIPVAIVDFFVRIPEANANLLIGYDIVTDLSGFGGQAQSCIDWNTKNFDGALPVYAVIDYRNEYAETVETNNVAEGLVTVLSRSDLFVSQIVLDDPEPVVGQPVGVHISVGNQGHVSAGLSTMTLFENTTDITSTVSSADTSVVAGGESTVALVWTPQKTGWHRLYAVGDQNNVIPERHERNNSRWIDVYVGFAGSIELDSGNPASDPTYTAETGAGVIENAQPDTLGNCGSENYQTYRRDPQGQLQYRFDHLLPGHFYHLDVTFYNCPGEPQRLQAIAVDSNLITDAPVDLGDGQVHRLSFLLDPALYADRSVAVAIADADNGINGVVINEINLRDVDYRYADAGSNNDSQYPGQRGYGWLDTTSTTSNGWGSLPSQTVRIDQADRNLTYRFDNLLPDKRYKIQLSFLQGAGANPTTLKVQIDGLDLGSTFNLATGVPHVVNASISPLYYDDGTILVMIVRPDGAGPFVNQIALEEETVVVASNCEVSATPSGMNVYGNVTITGIPAPVGTVVEAVSPLGDIVGCFVVTTAGIFGAMRIYGEDDTATPIIPGMRTGELVAFRVAGAQTVASPPIYWNDATMQQVDLDAGSVVGQSILLKSGWNMTSFSVEPPSPLVAQVLSSINGRYDRVLGEGVIYLPQVPLASTLEELHCGPGYYLRLTGSTSANLLVEGVPCPVDTPLSLHQGWNWIAYLPNSPAPTAEALQSIDTLYQWVMDLTEWYDPADLRFNTLHQLQPGKAYLIYMKEAATLTYPVANAAAKPGREPAQGAACDNVQPTPFATMVYGNIAIGDLPAPVGTMVELLTPAGDVAGCFIVNQPGLYGMVFAYGADTTAEPQLPGFRMNEPITVRVNGSNVVLSDPVLWQDDKASHQRDISIALDRSLYLPFIGGLEE